MKKKHESKAASKAAPKHEPVAAVEALSNLSHIKIAKAESNSETWTASGQPQGTQLYTVSCSKDGASKEGAGKTQVEQFVLEHTHAV